MIGVVASASSSAYEATRFYLPSSGLPQATPLTVSDVWDATGAKSVLPLGRTKTNTPHTYKSAGFSSVVPGNVLLAQYVSEPLKAQTVKGTWSMVLQGYESDVALNASLQLVIRIVSNDGTVERGEVYGGHNRANNAVSGALAEEFATSTDATRLIPKVTGVPVIANRGDRLIIEVGFRADYTSGVAYSAELDLGDNQLMDYNFTSGITARTFDPWVETNQKIIFEAENVPVEETPLVKSVAYWKAEFDDQANAFKNYNLPKSQSADSMDYYDMAYGVDGYVSMFEATGLTTYLDEALTLVNNMVNDAVISSSLGPNAFGDSYLGWVSQRADVIGEEVPLFESYCWRYVCRLLTAIKNNSAVYAASLYKTQYDAILAFTEQHIFDKWYARSANSYIYRSRTHMASHWSYIALHLRRHTLNSTRQSRCDTIRANIDSVGLSNFANSSLKSQMQLGVVSSNAYFWSDVWGSTARPGQDVAHGNAVLAYIVEARDYGTTWTQTDIERFGETLSKVIMPTQPEFVDGTGANGTGWIADGFVKLGRFLPSIQYSLETYSVQGQGQYMAAMAENARRHST